MPKPLDKLAQPALQRNADNTNRENDVAMIASALAAFIKGSEADLDVHRGMLATMAILDSIPGSE